MTSVQPAPRIGSRKPRSALPSQTMTTIELKTTEDSATSNRSSTRRSSLRHSSQAQIVERMLLKEVSNRAALYESITKNNQTRALSVILILSMKPNINESSLTVNTLNSHATRSLAPIDELTIIKRVRDLFDQDEILFDDNFSVVKYDDHRIFILCNDPVIAMKRMLRARKIVNDEFGSTEHATIRLRGGCELGNLFELPGDYFGDPVNVASKLGEDTAEPGELLVSFGGNELKYINQMRNRAHFELGRVEVSGVEIEYYDMTEKERDGRALLSKIFPCCALDNKRVLSCPSPNKGSETKPDTEVKEETMKEQYISGNNMHLRSSHLSKVTEESQLTLETVPSAPEGAEWKELIILQSDLSGFTKLTKKYGILHFMTLIMNCRKIFERQLLLCDGEVLKYDGDNVICKFPSSEVAVQCVIEAYREIAEYNEGKEKDFQIRCKIGMAKGVVLVSDDGDLMGDAWEDCCLLSEETAQVGEILITEVMKKDLECISLDCEFEPRPESGEVPAHYNLKLS